MKIATWNINSLKIRLPQVIDWLARNNPDILAIQETKIQDCDFPMKEIQSLGYKVIHSCQKAYNGVAIIFKGDLKGDILTDLPTLEDPQRRILIATIDDIRIVNLYVPNGENLHSEKYQYKLNWLEKIIEYIREDIKQYKKFVVLGDFNIVPEARDVHNPLLWEGQIFCSEPERSAFSQLLQSGLTDSFRLFDQPEKSYTWWDYRMLAFRRNHGLRIDHILVSHTLAAHCASCTIDKMQRKVERPSDHAPVLAVFNNPD